jgi:hypothetical protein
MAAHADYKSTVLTDSPSGYWRLNAVPWTSYATNQGWAGTAADGVIGSWVREAAAGAIAGDANAAMQFVGNGNARVTIPYNADLNPDPGMGQSFTWEAWVKSACKKGNALALVVNRNGESGYVVYVNGDGTLGFNLNRGPSGGYWSGVSIPAGDYAQLAGQWFHLACVYDATGGIGFGSALLYTNGVLCASNAIPDAPPLVNSGGAMVLGDRNYVGSLDEVAVYTNALDESTLLSHYQAGTGGTGSYPATILTANPVGYWRLGETGGVATPPSLAGNSGTVGSPADGTYTGGATLQATGVLAGDKAAAFSSGVVSVPYSTGLNPNGAFTVECWAYKQSGSGYPLCVMSALYYVGGVERNGWLIYDNGDNWQFRLGDDQGYVATAAGGTAQVGVWYHLAGVYDGTRAVLYVNGVESGSATLTRPFAPNPGWNTEIGGSTAFGRYFSGTLDEAAIYPRALTSAELLAHYQAAATNTGGYGTQILADNPIGYWRLNDTASGGVMATNLGYLAAAGNGTFSGTSMLLTNDTPLVGDSDAALYFPGSGRIDIPLNEALVRTNTFSYEFWYKEDPGVTGHRSPMWWRDEPATGDTRGWVHYIADNPEGRGHVMQVSSATTTWDGITAVPLSFAQDVWQHLVCTFDGVVKKIYLDGAIVQVSTNVPGNVKLVQRSVCSISSGNYPFVGFLDEVAYYTNALSAERVQAHYVAARNANPPVVAPTFRLDAVSVTSFEGATVTVPTLVLGTPPFAYLWYKGTTALPNQTNATLTLSPAKESDSGDYKLTVSNGAGSVDSQVATILIQKAPPTIVTEPSSATRLQGSSVTFAVNCGGSQPLSYQWQSNSIAIPGATAATLTLDNIQTSFAADYTVTITNIAGTATSQTASLAVVPVAAGSLAAIVVTAQPVAYWRLDEASGSSVAHDYVGGHDGTYDSSVTLGQPSGIVGDTDQSAAFAFAGITVPYSSDLNPFTTFSLEAWVKVEPAGTGIDRPILWSANTYAGWTYGYMLSVNSSDAWSFTTGQKTSGFNTLTGGAATNEGWDHVICTFDDATGDKRLYVNGELVAQTTTATGTFGPNPAEGTLDNPVPFDQGIGWNVRDYTGYYGGLDEVAIYNYALSPAQVQAHYAAGTGAVTAPTITITSAGGNIVLTWSQGLLLQASEVTGPWTTNSAAVSPWTNTPSMGRQFFRAFLPR